MAQLAVLYAGSTLLTPLYRLYREAFGFSQLTLTLVYAAYVLGNLTALLGYRASLEIVNQIAPADRRAEVLVSYILFMYAGNSLPIIGIGLLATAAGSFTADVTFALVIGGCAVLALALGAKRRPSSTA